MPTFTAQMQTEIISILLAANNHSSQLPPPSRRDSRWVYRAAQRCSAFTLAESMVVLVIFSLFTIMAVGNLRSVLMRNSFNARVHNFVSSMQAAVTAAAQTGRRYEVIIDPVEQTYLLREITTSDLSEVLEEEIIAEGDFGENCRVAYVLFDDGEFTDQFRAKFRAGRSGWNFGGVIVLLDEDEQPYSVVVNRLSNIVRLQPGEVEIMMPRTKEEMPF